MYNNDLQKDMKSTDTATVATCCVSKLFTENKSKKFISFATVGFSPVAQLADVKRSIDEETEPHTANTTLQSHSYYFCVKTKHFINGFAPEILTAL